MNQSGQLLKFYRELRNLSPEVLAEEIGVDYRTYLKIENRSREMKVSELLKLSERLEISPEMLYSTERIFNSFNNIESISFCVGNNNSNNVVANEDLLEQIRILLKKIIDKL